MSQLKGGSTLIAFKVDRDLAKILDSLPNKSEFIRSAVETHLGRVCPLCRGSGLAHVDAQQDLTRLVERHPNVRCESCGVLEPRPCHPANERTHDGACADSRTHNFENFGTYFCQRCFEVTVACTKCGRHFAGDKRQKLCASCRAKTDPMARAG